MELFQSNGFDGVIHLAAQAGVRYSLVNPHAYVGSNLAGFMTVLNWSPRVTFKELVEMMTMRTWWPCVRDSRFKSLKSLAALPTGAYGGE